MIFEFVAGTFLEVALTGIFFLFMLSLLLVAIALWIKPDGDRLLKFGRSKNTRKAIDIRDLDGDN